MVTLQTSILYNAHPPQSSVSYLSDQPANSLEAMEESYLPLPSLFHLKDLESYAAQEMIV